MALDWLLGVRSNNRKRLLHTALLVLMLSSSWRRLRLWLRRLLFRFTAETPRVHFQSTPENTALLARCVTMMTRKYFPLWYVFNGHLQTLQLAREMKSIDPFVVYERQILDMPDGGIISLDWALPPRDDGSVPRVSDLDPAKRTMLLLPGLTGGSSEFYIRSVVKRMVALGWQVVVMNARGCADTPLKTTQFFCVAYTQDLRYVVRHFKDKYAFLSDAFVVVGFSLGSNVLVKYLGEEKDDAQALLHAGVSVGNPFDVVECSRNLSSSFFYRNTYNTTLNKNLLELFFRKSNAHEVYKNHPKLDLESLRNAKTLVEFDDRFTRIVFNYESVHAFYTDASSSTRIKSVRVPLLCVNAEDDPISTASAIPYEDAKQNPHVVLCVTKRGGHLGFYEGDSSGIDDPQASESVAVDGASRMWSVKVIAEFAESVREQQRLRRALPVAE